MLRAIQQPGATHTRILENILDSILIIFNLPQAN